MKFTVIKTIDINVEKLVELIEGSIEDYVVAVCDPDEVEQIDINKLMVAVGGYLEAIGLERQKEER
jgi:hypothetical protein